MRTRFSVATLSALDEAEEVDIETRTALGAKPRRTTIWIVVAGGEVYVRSIRGSRGIWYRELRRSRNGAIHLGRRAICFRATVVRSPPTLRTISGAFRRKYARSPYLSSVLGPDTLAGTLRLGPNG